MLKKTKPEILDVLSTFLERNEALPVYSKIVNRISGTLLYKNIAPSKQNNTKLYCIYDFPGYLEGHVNKKNWKLKCINTYKGSLILLKNYKNADDYLKHKFSYRRRTKYRTYKRRLETCFDITYKSYFGDIDKDEYESLFRSFYKMTQKRFLEKKIQNCDLSRWDIYHRIAYPLINSKEAVLFVIYSNNAPISISLAFVRGNTIYGYLKAYDTDYSKFSIGFTDFIKQLHWCYSNGIEFFDMLKGNYPYKLRLVDTQYHFQKHILYNSNSMLTTLSANFIIAKTQAFYALVKCLKKLNFNVLYYKFINYKYRNKELAKVNNELPHIVTSTVKMPKKEMLLQVNINDESLHVLKRTVYNFLYSNQESLNDVNIYAFKNEPDAYLIKGNKNIQKITINHA